MLYPVRYNKATKLTYGAIFLNMGSRTIRSFHMCRGLNVTKTLISVKAGYSFYVRYSACSVGLPNIRPTIRYLFLNFLCTYNVYFFACLLSSSESSKELNHRWDSTLIQSLKRDKLLCFYFFKNPPFNHINAHIHLVTLCES